MITKNEFYGQAITASTIIDPTSTSSTLAIRQCEINSVTI